MKRLKDSTARMIRDWTIFLVGIGGIINEMFRNGPPRDTLMILFGAMIGLPVFLRQIDQQRGDGLSKKGTKQ